MQCQRVRLEWLAQTDLLVSKTTSSDGEAVTGARNLPPGSRGACGAPAGSEGYLAVEVEVKLSDVRTISSGDAVEASIQLAALNLYGQISERDSHASGYVPGGLATYDVHFYMAGKSWGNFGIDCIESHHGHIALHGPVSIWIGIGDHQPNRTPRRRWVLYWAAVLGAGAAPMLVARPQNTRFITAFKRTPFPPVQVRPQG